MSGSGAAHVDLMNDFNSTQHPRVADGTFTTKEQSSPEFDKIFTSSLIGSAHQLEIDDVVTISHAEGDFDASDLGIEGIELWRGMDGLHAEAYADLDFANLEGPHAGNRDRHTEWLKHNRDAIDAAVTAAYPAMSLSDRYGDDWELRGLAIDLDPATGEVPATTAGLVDLVRATPTVGAFSADTHSGSKAFFENVAYQMRLADLNTELAAA